jgi:dipeptidyl aminopeptidase/acylaminoacyl peptidase
MVFCRRIFLCVLAHLSAQAHAVDFDAALSLPKRTENKIFRDRVEANWLPGGRSFWYRVRIGPESQEFVLINAADGSRKAAKSLQELGVALNEEQRTSAMKLELRPTTRTGAESRMRLLNKLGEDVDLFWINQKGEHVRYGGVRAGAEREQHTFEGHVWLLTSRTGVHLAVIEAGAAGQIFVIDGKGISKPRPEPKPKESGAVSPDGRWAAMIEKGAVWLRDRKKGSATPFAVKAPFAGGIAWSPDSGSFVVSHCEEVKRRQVTIVESSPGAQLQPRVKTFDYAKPGDPLPRPQIMIFRIGSEPIRVVSALFATPFTEQRHIGVTWAPDSSEFYFDYNQRGHQLYRVLAVNARTGAVRVVVEERAQTFIDYTHKTWRHWLHRSGELLWMSERSGWCHLYLCDVKKGTVKHAITKGDWVVREVLRVDEEKRELWFLASGLRPEEDPYHLHLCRAGFDGGGFRQLTEGDGSHRIEFSPDRSFFVDTWSRADLPPVTELRRSSDGGLVCVLERANASALVAAGWTLPERFVARARDGKTGIHGILIKPSHFDAAKKYPVVEEIYAGPHGAFAPKEFGRLLRQHQLAELGFIIVQLDGMGTNHRGKAFHDVCWKNLKDSGFPDRKLWITEAAKTRPWMDLGRVGISGGSAGGQSAMRALLDHHDFYHVAVADCGCHDNRMDKIWWNEQWMGWPVDESYAKSSNKEDAAKLQGRLLLIVGELDTNVDPASTAQVVAALQKAGKSFDFMPIAGTGHGAAETPYGSRLRMEFLVRHLRP